MNKIIKELIPYLVIILIVVLIRTFLVTPAIVNGDSMEKTLTDGDVVIVNKLNKRLNKLKRFDIVVINYEKEKLVKRIIGFPNENVKYIDDILYVNNKKIKIPFDFEYTKDFEYEGKPNTYFVLGDNRNVSKDSRTIGGILKKDILGTVNLRIFPFKTIGKIK